MRFLNASGKHDIHHSLYHTSSSSSAIMTPSFVKCFLVGNGGVPGERPDDEFDDGGDFVGVDLEEDVGEGV